MKIKTGERKKTHKKKKADERKAEQKNEAMTDVVLRNYRFLKLSLDNSVSYILR